eukprot:TRINITY_DN47843_c0_g1_i1.p1 TRINITY_DN47843_c0_g1~~TRINITY_DN47843_c0_g1_i1.p1  ORF type:complete len:958 (-),score=139.93 TRINITY_DN47843_c0_g1_i1:585-3395(-)
MSDSLAILPSGLGKKERGEPQDSSHRPKDPRRFLPTERGGVLLSDPQEAPCPYTFSDSPAYVRARKAEKDAQRSAELEGQEETKGFLRSIEELARRQKWEEAHQVLERRTAVPSGLFLVTRAVLRWNFGKFADAIADAEEALRQYGCSKTAGPLAAAFGCLAKVCLGSQASYENHCSNEMRGLIAAWKNAEADAARCRVVAGGVFAPLRADRVQEDPCPADNVLCLDGLFGAANGVRLGYVLMKNTQDARAPLVVHFPCVEERAADYRSASDLRRRLRDASINLLVIDYRSYGWSCAASGVPSADPPSLATCLADAEALMAEKRLPEALATHGFAWPHFGGVMLSGRGIGAHVAIHLAALYPRHFQWLVLESCVGSSLGGHRLGRGQERADAVDRWKKELQQASLEVLHPLASDMSVLSDLEKMASYTGGLLLIHGLADTEVPHDASESLHGAATHASVKELVLVDGACRQDMLRQDAYWSAIRKFVLKLQLADHIASPGGGPVERLCVVCAERATSKCGQCQKVWYCGRKHQAEHWKVHKSSCKSGCVKEKEATPKPAEAEACLMAAVVANISCAEDISPFLAGLASIAGQSTGSLSALYVCWHCSVTEAELSARLEGGLAIVQDKCSAAGLACHILRASEGLARLAQLQKVLETQLASVPPHGWLILPELPESREIWSPCRAARLLEMTRRSATDARVHAVMSACQAQPGPAAALASETAVANSDCGNMEVHDLDGVLAALNSKRASIVTDFKASLGDYAVHNQALRTFLKVEKPAVLCHALGPYRLQYWLSSAFGKKVVRHDPAAGDEWLRWVNPASWRDRDVDDGISSRRGKELWQLVQGVQDAPRSEAAAVEATLHLRRSLESRLLQSAGGSVSRKEVRQYVVECVGEFFQESGLGSVIGLNRWTREVTDEVVSEAAAAFAVKIKSEPGNS